MTTPDPRLPVLGPDPADDGAREARASIRAAGLPVNARKPGWLRVGVPGGERYGRVRDTLSGLQAPHRLRRGPLPERRRVLGRRDGHRDAHGRHLHPRLPLLPGEDRGPPARRSTPTSRATWPRRSASSSSTTWWSRASTATTCPTAAPAHFAEAIRRLKEIPGLLVEVLTPDFQGDAEAVRTVGRAAPGRLREQPRDGPAAHAGGARRPGRLRPDPRRAGADEAGVPRGGRPSPPSWSGWARAAAEVEQAMRDLRAVGVEILTLGQYLRPSGLAPAGGRVRDPGARSPPTSGRGWRSASATWRAGRWSGPATGPASSSCGASSSRAPRRPAVTEGADATRARHRGGAERKRSAPARRASGRWEREFPLRTRDRRGRLGRPGRGARSPTTRGRGPLPLDGALPASSTSAWSQLQRQGRIGFYIGAIGEEATVLGTVAGMAAAGLDLPVLPRARAPPSSAACRSRPSSATSSATPATRCKGHQMPCHEAWAPGRFVSISSPIATQVPQAVGRRLGRPDPRRRHGVARLLRRRRHQRQRLPHRRSTSPAVHKIPVIFACRNNGWAISVPRGAADRLRDHRPEGHRLRHARRAGGRQRPAGGPRPPPGGPGSGPRPARARRCSSASPTGSRGTPPPTTRAPTGAPRRSSPGGRRIPSSRLARYLGWRGGSSRPRTTRRLPGRGPGAGPARRRGGRGLRAQAAARDPLRGRLRRAALAAAGAARGAARRHGRRPARRRAAPREPSDRHADDEHHPGGQRRAPAGDAARPERRRARRGRGQVRRRLPRHARGSRRSSARSGSSTRRWPRAASSAPRSAWRSTACGRCPRSSSPTSSSRPSTRS